MDESQCWSWPAPSQKAVTTRTSTNSNLQGLFGLSSTLSDTGEVVFGHKRSRKENEVRKVLHPSTFIWADLSDQKSWMEKNMIKLPKYWRQVFTTTRGNGGYSCKFVAFIFFLLFIFLYLESMKYDWINEYFTLYCV